MCSRLAELIRARLLLAWLAGAAVWLAWLISLALGGWTHDRGGHRVGADHVQYYVVGQLIDEGTPQRIYDPETMRQRQREVAGPNWRGYLPFRYPPFYALCFAFTSRLPYEASWLAWTTVSLGLWAVSGWWLNVPWRAWLGWSACFFPVFAAISFGQNSLVSLAILSGAAVLWLRDRPLAAGLVAGLLAFKPQLAVGLGLLFLLDARRSWPALLGLLATTAGLAALGWLVVPEASEAFLASLGGNLGASDPMSLAWNMGSQGFWELLLPGASRAARVLSLSTSGAGLAVLVALWWRLRQHRRIVLAVAILLTPWLTPYIMVYDWTILLVPAVLLWHEGRAAGGPLLVGQAGRLSHEGQDRWLVLAAAVWLAGLVAGPLAMKQVSLLGVALHPALPMLVAVVLGVWAGLGAETKESADMLLAERLEGS